jgi:hypothetical protein
MPAGKLPWKKYMNPSSLCYRERKEIGQQCLNPDQMLAKILKQGWVECNSEKNKRKLYKKLKDLKLKYSSKFIGRTKGQGKDINKYSNGKGSWRGALLRNKGRCNIKLAAQWIKNGHLDLDHVIKITQSARGDEEYLVLKNIMEEELTLQEIRDRILYSDIMYNLSNTYSKYCVFDNLRYHRVIHRIEVPSIYFDKINNSLVKYLSRDVISVICSFIDVRTLYFQKG